jgi:universal stress protein E
MGMHLIERILVAVKNPGAKWSPAIAKATQLARAWGAHIELFHAIDTRFNVDALGTYEGGVAEFEAQQCAPFAKMLERLAQQVRRHGISVTTAVQVDHPIYEAILRQAHSCRAQLIVADCHNGLNIAPSLLHRTDWELARLSTVPVLIVRRPRLYRRPSVLAAVDPTHAYAKPLNLDADILGLGAAFCAALRGTLHATHAYAPAPFGAEVSTALAAGTAVRVDAIAAADARVAFNTVLRSAAIPVERRYLIGGHPADAIKHAVAESAADLVVMGSMSRSGLQRLLIGNTADKLLSRLPCDLLLVKPAGIVNDIPGKSRGTRLVVTPRCN